MEDKITKLTALWYEYVGMDYRKDRDCHWYINKVWRYGVEPYYRIEHHGYVYESKNYRHYKTYGPAEKALYREIQKAFLAELKWAKIVIAYKLDYDKIQVDKADWLIKNYKEE